MGISDINDNFATYIADAKKWYEEQGFEVDSDNKSIQLFVSNGKGGDGFWIDISRNQIEEAATMYWLEKRDNLAEEYAHFDMDEPASDEQERAFAKYLLSEGREDDALCFLDDEEIINNLKKELESENIKNNVRKNS